MNIRERSSFSPLVEKNSGERNVMIYVTSLDGVAGSAAENTGRLKEFARRWKELCGSDPHIGRGDGDGLRMRQCYGEVGGVRGEGVTRAFIRVSIYAVYASCSS